MENDYSKLVLEPGDLNPPQQGTIVCRDGTVYALRGSEWVEITTVEHFENALRENEVIENFNRYHPDRNDWMTDDLRDVP